MNAVRRFMVAGVIGAALVNVGAAAREFDTVKSPVPVVLDGRFTLSAKAGSGVVPLHVSRDWNVAQADVTRAVIFIHGWPRRDLGADDYVAEKAGAAARDTLFITPQFLIDADVGAHRLPPTTLRWGLSGWRKGHDALAPAALSSFDVIDALFAHLADRKLFPHLKTVVLAGHSAGGQFVQRYAVVGEGERALAARDVAVRYVVANPATYLYFDARRRQPDGGFGVDAAARACADLGEWNYGLASKVPPYVARPVDAAALEKRYLARDVIYLAGTADNDPDGDAVDKSCGAASQGDTRFARAVNYAAYVDLLAQGRGRHRLFKVPGVAHHSYEMYASRCGLAALFDAAACQ